MRTVQPTKTLIDILVLQNSINETTVIVYCQMCTSDC